MKKIKSQKTARRLRIKRGIRKNIFGTVTRLRLTVFRSNTNIYAQIIDDNKGLTLASFSSMAPEIKDTKAPKIQISAMVGKKLAEVAVSNGVSKVVFDRNGYSYHGRIKALAEGAREGGLIF